MRNPEFTPNQASESIISGLYQELSLNQRINTKGFMLAQLACKTIPGIYLHLKDKYLTKTQKGELKVLKRQLQKGRPNYKK